MPVGDQMIETDMLSISVVEAGFRIQRASSVEPEYIMQLKNTLRMQSSVLLVLNPAHVP